MSDSDRLITNLPPAQQALMARCFHPSGSFVEFRKEEVEQSIPSLFQKIVRKYPDRIAIKTANHALTYAELNATANRVARTILAQQGNESEPVGMLFEKDAPLIAAMLGVLKAGKFFVLLDPSFPKTRIEAVLEDSQANLVLTNRQNVSLAREVIGNRCRLLEFQSVDGGISTEDLRLPILPNALATIVYTSGSTGKPKGVVQNHRNILHRVMLRTNSFHICEHDRLSLLPSATSNAITATFVALLKGAALLPFDVQKEGVTRLADWLSQERISICLMSSPLFRNLAETLTGKERLLDLRVLRLTSEWVYKTDVDLYKKYFSPTCVLSTGLSSSETGPLRKYLIGHDADIPGSEVPVGYAVESKEIMLLDDRGKEIGFNEVGEIAVRSSYLSPGYWRKPDLTKVKFISDSKGGDERIYLTGDLGMMLPDGCLVYKGRKDFRVKVRGYGVEVAEVEKALREHTAVREVVVVTGKNETGEPRLVAYVTSSNQPAPSVSELRNFMKEKLPDYMIPSAFMMLDAMPLTPNGKIDRRALPDPGRSRPELDALFVPPRTPVEEELVRIWAEVLSLDQIGIYDRFFDLGGHSLAAARVVSRVFKTFELELPIQSLFQSPTVAEMAAMITQNEAKKLRQEDLTQILAELESLSEQEAKEFAIREGAPTTKSTKR